MSALAFFKSRLGLGLLGALALGFVVWRIIAWHDGKAEAAIAAAVKARDAELQGAFDDMKRAANQWKANFEGERDARIAERRADHEADLRRIGAAADDLRLRGPGLAAAAPGCRPGAVTELSARAGGRDQAAARSDAPAGGLPAPDGGDQFAVVPWGWLVQRAEEHDALLSEAGAWRQHDAEMRALYGEAGAELRRQLDAARPEFGDAP